MTDTSRNRSRRRLAALMTGLVVPALLLVAAPAALAAMAPAPAVQATKPVPVHPVQPNKARTVPMPAWHAPASSWPAAGTPPSRCPPPGPPAPDGCRCGSGLLQPRSS